MSATPNTSQPIQAQQHIAQGPPMPWHHRVIRRLVVGFFAIGSRLLNPLIVRFAGSRRLAMMSVITHQGRRSGRAYSTPVAARRTPNGFVIPLTFGKQTDSCKNILAAGGCLVKWKGTTYVVAEPELVDWPTVRPSFYPLERSLIPIISVEGFLRLKQTHTGAA